MTHPHPFQPGRPHRADLSERRRKPPCRLPIPSEARPLASTRREISELLCFDVNYITVNDIVERYKALCFRAPGLQAADISDIYVNISSHEPRELNLLK
jgi:hypothetical protein